MLCAIFLSVCSLYVCYLHSIPSFTRSSLMFSVGFCYFSVYHCGESIVITPKNCDYQINFNASKVGVHSVQKLVWRMQDCLFLLFFFYFLSFYASFFMLFFPFRTSIFRFVRNQYILFQLVVMECTLASHSASPALAHPFIFQMLLSNKCSN